MPPMDSENKIPLGISSCLLGERVRFDGGHKKNNYILDSLGQYFRFRSFCPEMAIGLGVPRATIRLIELDSDSQNRKVRAVGVKDPTIDVTEKLSAEIDNQQDWLPDVYGYILKKDSPSCGMQRVKQYRVTNQAPVQAELEPKEWTYHVERLGTGLFAQSLMQRYPNLPLEEEGRLCDPVLRENFVSRVFIYKHWRSIFSRESSESAGKKPWSSITDFHAKMKWVLYSHDQDKARELGSLLAQKHADPIQEVQAWYESELMALLRIPATRKNHVNVLEHIRGYLKNRIDKEEKQEIGESIEDYRQGLLPLIVPITLLRHYFRKYPDPYITNSWYLQPHAKQLMLLNQI